jgi:CheY-like chemotaxis protein
VTKILLVEDHPDIRDVVRSQLERLGFVVSIAKNGKEGVETALAAKPDLILMNCRMPEMDGLQAMRILRANPETKNISILAATAMFEPSDIQRCIAEDQLSLKLRRFIEANIPELSGRVRVKIRY